VIEFIVGSKDGGGDGGEGGDGGDRVKASVHGPVGGVAARPNARTRQVYKWGPQF
jgi:hypothetical protein